MKLSLIAAVMDHHVLTCLCPFQFRVELADGFVSTPVHVLSVQQVGEGNETAGRYCYSHPRPVLLEGDIRLARSFLTHCRNSYQSGHPVKPTKMSRFLQTVGNGARLGRTVFLSGQRSYFNPLPRAYLPLMH